jgi:DNA-binding response OmpR family regulator
MQKIFVVDDDPDILELVSFNLEKAGYDCLTEAEGERVLDLARRFSPDLMILDIMLPGISGLDILKKVRAEDGLKGLPVIMLTAKTEEVDRVLGLELGADDYVTKPFSIRELVLRVQRVLERTGPDDSSPVLRCNAITVDCDRYEVRVKGEPVRLTTTEFNLLVYLIRYKGRVLSRDRLLEQVWGYRYGGTTRTVDTHVQRLREKLGAEADCIETIRGIGYRMEPVAE